MFVEDFTNFIKYYGRERKIKLFGFFLLSLIAGFWEFLGIALIYPFILLIVKPENIIYTKYYSNFADFFHVYDSFTNALILGLIVTLVFVAKNLFMIFSLYLQNKFINKWKLDIGRKFMHYYLFSPYKNSLEISPSEKIYNLTFLISQTLDGFIFRIINLITNVAIVIMILTLLFINFLFAALITSVFVVFCIAFQNKFFKKKISEISEKFFKISATNNEKTIENISNIKEIKILSAEDCFYKEYSASQKDFTNILSENNFYASIPPYIIEILVVLSLFVLAGIISIQNIDNTSWMIASYAIVVAAIFRIAPALNRIQSSVNAISASRDFVKTMVIEYEKLNLDFIEEEESDFEINFRDNIKLENICFSYKKEQVIKNLNLEIKKGEFIGIIGLSGAGKSTLADIIMGLLPPDSGKIFVDDLELNQRNFSAMRKLIGYVPQQINILDGSFKRNVALGDEKYIDEEKVIEALKQAQLYDFISSFDEGINAKVIVGSAGISQGQKQRLAIARALYRNPKILILDEATSSLDVETEYEITQMLTSLKGGRTIIAIAHRLSTLKKCDRLIYLKKGKIVDTGTFEELSQKHKDFEKLVKLSSLNNNENK